MNEIYTNAWHEALALLHVVHPPAYDWKGFWDDRGYMHWFGGAECFYGASASTLVRLVELGMLDPTKQMNLAPDPVAFIVLLTDFPELRAGGYLRYPDGEVMLDSVVGGPDGWPIWRRRSPGLMEPGGMPRVSLAALAALEAFAATADECELSPDRIWCWWD